VASGLRGAAGGAGDRVVAQLTAWFGADRAPAMARAPSDNDRALTPNGVRVRVIELAGRPTPSQSAVRMRGSGDSVRSFRHTRNPGVDTFAEQLKTDILLD
jgi:hypothetical protein